MTIEEAIEYLKRADVTVGLKIKTRTAEALEMAIASLEAWGEIKQEINNLFSKPACYIPNYDAYKMFLEIIDKHIKEVENNE